MLRKTSGHSLVAMPMLDKQSAGEAKRAHTRANSRVSGRVPGSPNLMNSLGSVGGKTLETKIFENQTLTLKLC